ncbi:MAG: hypothetical protein F6J97_00450 [Leptolyngbya sp. SIO4C1]|nr:hypothetical protein [Leptolyngbya sp. SIO4C1]
MTLTMTRLNKLPRLRLASWLMAGAIALGMITRLVSALRYTTFDIGPAPDQIRDAFLYMDMLQGRLPTLGPASSVGGYSLPPLYYFLVFPVTLLSRSLTLQVLPNALFSLLSIPLFSWLVYRLLAETPQRRLLAALAGLWYSALFPYIFISNFEWNPVPVPCFLFAFVLLIDYQFSHRQIGTRQRLAWALYGAVTAVLVSLHSTTLFVMPVVYAGSLLCFIWLTRKRAAQWQMPALSLLVALLTLLPYWYGEMTRGFANTKQIARTILDSSDRPAAGLLTRLGRMAYNYLELGWQVYVSSGTGQIWLGGILALLVLLAVWRLRNTAINSAIWLSLLAIWAVYLYAASNYTEAYAFHYKLLIFFAPIVLTMAVLSRLSWQKPLQRLAIGLLSGFIAVSLLSNLWQDAAFLNSKFGAHRVMTTGDLTTLVAALPAETVLCDARYERWREQYHAVDYISTYLRPKPLRLVQTCSAGSYLIYPKSLYLFAENNLWPALTVASVQPLAAPAELVKETAVARVYRLRQAFEPTRCQTYVGDFYQGMTCSNLIAH